MSAHVPGSAPYPWPYDGRLAGGHLALLAVGWDRDWATRVHDPDDAIARCRMLGEAVADLGGELFAVAHRDGAALPFDGARMLSVPAVDAFYGSSLDHALRSAARTHLLIVGLGLEGPVHSTLRSGNDRGYECLLIADACAPCDHATASAAAKTVTMSGGIFGAIATVDAALEALATARAAVRPRTRPQEP
jgi:hypothetical protein